MIVHPTKSNPGPTRDTLSIKLEYETCIVVACNETNLLLFLKCKQQLTRSVMKNVHINLLRDGVYN